jgi:hypothetical protein
LEALYKADEKPKHWQRSSFFSRCLQKPDKGFDLSIQDTVLKIKIYVQSRYEEYDEGLTGVKRNGLDVSAFVRKNTNNA